MISAVVLAAGASTRMGTQKLLLPLGGEPLVRRTVRHVCDAGFDDVLVVLGSEWENDAGGARRPADPPRRERGVRERHGQLVPHGGRAPGRQSRPPCLRSPISRSSRRTSTGPCSTPTASTRRPSSASVTATSWRRRICSSASSSPSSPSCSMGPVPCSSGTTTGRLVLQFPPDLLLDIDTPEDYELAKSRLASGR